ncbi:hypothetical protein KQH27_00945 [bacterium]|nr:hypothetical protein [bacterium]
MNRLVRSNPQILIDNLVFRPPPLAFSSVGFKIFYFHARKGSGEMVWKYLKSHKDIKVIHLKRKNMLRTFLSHRKALQNKIWVDISGNKIAPPPIYIDPEECNRFFERMTKWQSDSDNFFSEHPKIEIFYEKMVKSTEIELNRVQQFLDVDNRNIGPSTFKQAKRTISKDIINYEELKKCFKGTKWEEFFKNSL